MRDDLATIARRVIHEDPALAAEIVNQLSRKALPHGMTERQREVYVFIQNYTADHDGVPPSYAEIASELGIGKSSVYRVMEALKERGCIRTLPGLARTVCIIDSTPDGIAVPIGRAGSPG